MGNMKPFSMNKEQVESSILIVSKRSHILLCVAKINTKNRRQDIHVKGTNTGFLKPGSGTKYTKGCL